LKKPLILGYGNPDRQDDGVAWHVLHALALRLGLPAPDSYEDEFPPNDRLDLEFQLQLTPEMAETVSAYERVCFVDAHTGSQPAEVQLVGLESIFQHSPFTHHLTPQSLLAMSAALYAKSPAAVMLSIQGFRFEFERELSPQTAAMVPRAVDLLADWLEGNQ
jgi:hydrogenase maturation protease